MRSHRLVVRGTVPGAGSRTRTHSAGGKSPVPVLSGATCKSLPPWNRTTCPGVSDRCRNRLARGRGMGDECSKPQPLPSDGRDGGDQRNSALSDVVRLPPLGFLPGSRFGHLPTSGAGESNPALPLIRRMACNRLPLAPRDQEGPRKVARRDSSPCRAAPPGVLLSFRRTPAGAGGTASSDPRPSSPARC